MQITLTASVTFEVSNAPKGPNAKATLEQAIRQRLDNKVVVGPLVVESDMGKHEVTVIETFIPGYNLNRLTDAAMMPKQAYREPKDRL